MLKNKKGVSLAEVLAVIAISGIVASMVALFIIQSSRTIATHRENNNLIFETSLIFKELEKGINAYNPTTSIINQEGNLILEDGTVLLSITDDIANPGFKSIVVNNKNFPNDPHVLITAASFVKDTTPEYSKNKNYELYNFNIVTKTKDTDSVPLTKNYTTSFLIKK